MMSLGIFPIKIYNQKYLSLVPVLLTLYLINNVDKDDPKWLVPDFGGFFCPVLDKNNISSYLGLLADISMKKVRISST